MRKQLTSLKHMLNRPGTECADVDWVWSRKPGVSHSEHFQIIDSRDVGLRNEKLFQPSCPNATVLVPVIDSPKSMGFFLRKELP